MSETPELRVEREIAITVPETFRQAVDVVRQRKLRGLAVREDWRDLQKDAPSCDLSLLATHVPDIQSFAIAPGIKASRLLHVESLYALSDLRDLSIHNYKTLDLARFPQLELLAVRDSAGLVGLDGLQSLRKLHMWGLRKADFSELNLRQLESARIIQAASAVTGLEGLDALVALRHLEIHNSRALTKIGRLPTKLAILKIDSCSRLTDLSFLSDNPSIDFLFATSIDSLRFLPSMRVISKLAFEAVGDGDLSPILRTKTLRSVFFPNKKKHSHKQEELQRVLDQRE